MSKCGGRTAYCKDYLYNRYIHSTGTGVKDEILIPGGFGTFYILE